MCRNLQSSTRGTLLYSNIYFRRGAGAHLTQFCSFSNHIELFLDYCFVKNVGVTLLSNCNIWFFIWLQLHKSVGFEKKKR